MNNISTLIEDIEIQIQELKEAQKELETALSKQTRPVSAQDFINDNWFHFKIEGVSYHAHICSDEGTHLSIYGWDDEYNQIDSDIPISDVWRIDHNNWEIDEVAQ